MSGPSHHIQQALLQPTFMGSSVGQTLSETWIQGQGPHHVNEQTSTRKKSVSRAFLSQVLRE